MKHVIRLDNVTKCFALERTPLSVFATLKREISGQSERDKKPVVALKNINVEIYAGEKIAIIGDNGAGKTTLLKVIAGLYQATKGRVIVEGDMVLVAGLGIGMMDELTVAENIILYTMIYGLERREAQQLLPDVLQWAELTGFSGAKLKTLSSGMKARLAFSAMRHFRKDVYLLDEVLAAGDRHFKEKCDQIFESYKRSANTFIVATHDLKFVDYFCDKALWVHKGNQMAFGFPSEIVEMYKKQGPEVSTVSASL